MHSNTQILTVIMAFCLCLPNCSTSRSSSPPVQPLDLSSEKLNFEAQLTLEGSVIRFSTYNREKSIWLVVEDFLNVGQDGFFMGETFSFISGSYVGTSIHSAGRAFILQPGETKIDTVDLKKNYENIDLSKTKPPQSSLIGIAAFDSADAAYKFLAYLKERGLEVRNQANLSPHKYYYECIWRSRRP